MKEKKVQVRGELALIPLIFVNSFAVVLMLYSGSGISAISSVPYAFNQVLPQVSLGTWTYIFQALLVGALFVLRGKIHLPYLMICFGIALANRCKMPIAPTDLFPREFSQITGFAYSRVKICFDVSCLALTVFMTWTFLGYVKGLGIGTVLAAFNTGDESATLPLEEQEWIHLLLGSARLQVSSEGHILTLPPRSASLMLLLTHETKHL